MVLKNVNLISRVVNVIKRKITQLKNAGLTQEDVRGMVYNRCYIKNCLDMAQGFCSVDGDNDKILKIANEIDKEIDTQFYTKYNTGEYYSIEKIKHHVNTPYTTKKVGKVIETQFEDLSEISGKSFKTDYETIKGKTCNLEQEFTVDGKLISKCKSNINLEE